MIGTELGSDAIHEKLDLHLCKARTLQESCDSLRTSHGTFLLATADATPFFRWNRSEMGNPKQRQISEPYTTRIQDHHESTKKHKHLCCCAEFLFCNVACESSLESLGPTRCNSVSWGCHCATGLGNLMELNRHELLATCWKVPNLIAKGKIAEVLANSIASGYLKWYGMTLRYDFSYVVCRLLKLVRSGIMHDLSLTFVILHNVNITYYYHINRSIIVNYIIFTYYHSVIYHYNILAVISYQLSGILLITPSFLIVTASLPGGLSELEAEVKIAQERDGTVGMWREHMKWGRLAQVHM